MEITEYSVKFIDFKNSVIYWNYQITENSLKFTEIINFITFLNIFHQNIDIPTFGSKYGKFPYSDQKYPKYPFWIKMSQNSHFRIKITQNSQKYPKFPFSDQNFTEIYWNYWNYEITEIEIFILLKVSTFYWKFLKLKFPI